MPTPIRLAAVDVDGTLLDPDGEIRPRVEQSIKAAMTAGCEVILATGRRLRSAAPIARRLGISTLILVDGAAICDLNVGETVYERTLPSQLQRYALDLMEAAGLPPILLESPGLGDRVFAGPPALDNPQAAGYLSRRDEVHLVPPETLARLPRIVSILGMGARERIEHLASLAEVAASFTSTFWVPSNVGYHTYVLGLNAPGVSKGEALRWLAERRGIRREQTLAVGDYENDVSLLASAGFAVAMGNAVKSVKSVAHAVVADNANDGVAEAFERWILSDEVSGQ